MFVIIAGGSGFIYAVGSELLCDLGALFVSAVFGYWTGVREVEFELRAMSSDVSLGVGSVCSLLISWVLSLLSNHFVLVISLTTLYFSCAFTSVHYKSYLNDLAAIVS